ncbi:MAG: purine-nucleoside phosphorylase [Clostridia bacterium]|nr:purine-nucleoside phosphorylase [Clostridia bacterium]
MQTPHIANPAPVGFGKTVLMPGDPKRSRWIAETFLTDPVLVNDVRGVQGYTGTYKGVKVTVMASGMGIPSIGIYSYELFNFFGVENIIRVGSAGGIGKDVRLRDVLLAIGANTNSNYAEQFGVRGTLSATCSYELLQAATEAAGRCGIDVKVGPLLSSDTFYDAEEDALRPWAKMGTLAVEMEAAGLYYNAMAAGKRALAICTVSDLPFTGEGCTALERQETFSDMIRLALETAVLMDGDDA